jgi:hypothetical protein
MIGSTNYPAILGKGLFGGDGRKVVNVFGAIVS